MTAVATIVIFAMMIGWLGFIILGNIWDWINSDSKTK